MDICIKTNKNDKTHNEITKILTKMKMKANYKNKIKLKNYKTVLAKNIIVYQWYWNTVTHWTVIFYLSKLKDYHSVCRLVIMDVPDPPRIGDDG